MKRKDFLKAGALGALAVPALLTSCSTEQGKGEGAPNIITNKKYRWRLTTTWPPNFPVLGEIASMVADWVREMSNGRMDIKVYGGGELVPALEVFDAVSSGAVELGSGASYYWSGKAPAAQFFAAVPFGMNAQQMTAWIQGGGGYALWEEVYDKFNVKPFLGGNTGVQMGGWFNREINSMDDLKGLKMRVPGLGGKTLEKAGGAPVLVAGGEIYTSLERGVIDATEWIGPYHDYKMGFYKIAKYYYSPGWHEPGTQTEFIANKAAFDRLPKDLQEILTIAFERAHGWILAEFDAKNGDYLDKLINEENVQLRSFPQEVLDGLRVTAKDALEELVGEDAISKKVYASYENFRKKNMRWFDLTERAYYNTIQQQEG